MDRRAADGPPNTGTAGGGAPTAGPRALFCFAHRGARAHAPENTLMAFDLAFDLGAEAIECDVRRTRDGALVIFHDATLQRTTDGVGPIAARTSAELRTLDAGHRWRVRQRVPTLDETLALVFARERAINLELKAESEPESLATAEAVALALGALSTERRAQVLVSSFTLAAVAHIASLVPGLRVAALYGERVWRGRDLLAPAMELGAEAIHPQVDLVTPTLVRAAHAAGLHVNVWTANRWTTLARLLDWGVDGVFSDYPERVIIARARLAPHLL